MPLFGEASSPYDDIVEKVTAETLTNENWQLMIDISDRVNSDGAKGAKQCLLSIKKRLNHRDPHVVLFALSLLDCLWNNSSALFRREVSSESFISELTYRATNSNRHIGEKTRELIKKWSDNECKKDASLSLIESLYKDLLDEGYTFEPTDKTKTMSKSGNKLYSNDLNAMSAEEADIAKAIALSLSEQKQYTPAPIVKEEFKKFETTIQQVRALYDFEAVEANEISFLVGDLINVYDCSDPNWWRGQLVRDGKTGLFPSSFVTANVQDDAVSIEETVRNEPIVQKPTVQIDESVLKRCIELLELCDPTGETPDDPELAYFEQMSMAQIPFIDQKLAQIDKQHNLLAQVDVAIRDVLASYDNAVQQAHFTMAQHNPQPHMQQQQHHHQNYAQQQSVGMPQQPASMPQSVTIPQQPTTIPQQPTNFAPGLATTLQQPINMTPQPLTNAANQYQQ